MNTKTKEVFYSGRYYDKNKSNHEVSGILDADFKLTMREIFMEIVDEIENLEDYSSCFTLKSIFIYHQPPDL